MRYLDLPAFIHIIDSAFCSIRPESTIPITLDLGTNNEENLKDPLYLGLRQRRAGPEVYVEFMEEFMREMAITFPKLLVQFEVRSRLEQ